MGRKWKICPREKRVQASSTNPQIMTARLGPTLHRAHMDNLVNEPNTHVFAMLEEARVLREKIHATLNSESEADL